MNICIAYFVTHKHEAHVACSFRACRRNTFLLQMILHKPVIIFDIDTGFYLSCYTSIWNILDSLFHVLLFWKCENVRTETFYTLSNVSIHICISIIMTLILRKGSTNQCFIIILLIKVKG